MAEKQRQNDQDQQERRKWSKRPTYPFLDSNGVLVTKNRRRKLEVREQSEPSQELSIPPIDNAQVEGESDDAYEDLMIPTVEEAPLPKSEASKAQSVTPKHEPAPLTSSNSGELTLTFQQWNIVLSEQNTRCSLGRDKTCDLVIPNRFASRRHGRIECRNGQFYLCDHSFNGSYIKFDDGKKIHICRDEIHLYGQGVLSLGKPVNIEREVVIRFSSS